MYDPRNPPLRPKFTERQSHEFEAIAEILEARRGRTSGPDDAVRKAILNRPEVTDEVKAVATLMWSDEYMAAAKVASKLAELRMSLSRSDEISLQQKQEEMYTLVRGLVKVHPFPIANLLRISGQSKLMRTKPGGVGWEQEVSQLIFAELSDRREMTILIALAAVSLLVLANTQAVANQAVFANANANANINANANVNASGC